MYQSPISSHPTQARSCKRPHCFFVLIWLIEFVLDGLLQDIINVVVIIGCFFLITMSTGMTYSQIDHPSWWQVYLKTYSNYFNIKQWIQLYECLTKLLNENIRQESPPAWTQEAYRPPRSHSNFLLFGGRGGVPWQKFLFPVWTCIKPNLVSKIFPFTGGGGGSLDKIFFSQSEHVSSQIWCQKFFPLLGGSPSTKIFFWSEHVSSQIWCQKFFPLLRPGTPLPKNLRPGNPPKIWDCVLPRKSETGDPPPPEMWTDWNYYLPPSFGWRAVKIHKGVVARCCLS